MASLLSTDWWNPKTQNLVANGLSDLGYGLANSTNIGNGLGVAAQQQATLQPARDLQAEKIAAQKQQAQQLQTAIANLRDKYQRPDLADAVSQGYDVNKAWQDVLTKKAPVDLSSTTEGRQKLASQYGLTGADAQDYVLTGKLPGGNQSVRAGVGQPIFGRNRKTQAIEPWQSMTDGTMVNIANPNANPAEYDFNPGIAAGDRTNATVDAKSAAAARAALGGAQQAFDLANKAADILLNDTEGMADQFGNTLGVPHQMVPDWATLPGTPMARFRTELAQGQGNAFLQARQVLKGAGQVTDYEGAKAESAYSRMQLAAQKNNQDEFIAAVRDFKDAVNEGYQKIQAAAQGAYAQGGSGVTGNQPAQTSTGVQWSYSP